MDLRVASATLRIPPMGTMDLLNVATETGTFSVPPDLKGGPVSDEQVIENIRASEQFNFPIFTRQKGGAGRLIFVAGGPTLLDYLDQIRVLSKAGEYICTSNNTHDF